MNENGGLSAADVAAVTNNDRGFGGYAYPVMAFPYGGYGYGYGNGNGNGNNGFGDGSWIWAIILLALIGGNGFGWGNGFGGGNGFGAFNNLDASIDSRFISRDIAGVNQNVSTTGAGLASDICQGFGNTNTNIANLGYNLSSQIADSKYDTALAVLQNRYDAQLSAANSNAQMAQCCCDIREGIAGVNYNNALQTQQLSSQIATEACANRELDTANTQRILDKLCSMEIDNLQTRLGEKEAEIRELQLENSQTDLANAIVNRLQPVPTPSYLTLSPYQSIYNPFGYGNGCGCSGTFGNTIV